MNKQLLNGLFSSNSFLFNLEEKLNRKPYKIFYTGLIPKKIRKLFRIKSDLSQQNHVAECWKKLIQLYINNQLNRFEVKPKKDLSNKKIIWKYWGQGWDNKNLPDIVKVCQLSVEKNKGEYEVIYLDDNNIKEYLDYPEFINKKRENPNFKYAFFSDILRLMLLKCYGGIWADATFLFTDKIPNNLLNKELFIYSRDKNAVNKQKWMNLNQGYFSWNVKHRTNYLNSIIISQRKNKNIELLLQLMFNFWETQNNIPHYFFFQILFDELVKEGLIKNFDSLDDTLPHLLFAELNNPFDENVFRNITLKCNQHKLTYVKNCLPDSFYDYLKKEYSK